MIPIALLHQILYFILKTMCCLPCYPQITIPGSGPLPNSPSPCEQLIINSLILKQQPKALLLRYYHLSGK
jgi:hypothetical protein